MKKGSYSIVILGPQGSGKGTQASLLAERFNFYHVETGKIFRKIALQKTVLGKKIDWLINKRGILVPDRLVVQTLLSELRHVPARRGIIFDGYPRTISQARALDRIMATLHRRITHVLYMPISKKTTIARLSQRRTCEQCSRIFISCKSIRRGATVCPFCQGKIIQRADDRPAAIARRLSQYQKLTKPVVTWYRAQGTLYTVDGEPPIDAVQKKIIKLFNHA